MKPQDRALLLPLLFLAACTDQTPVGVEHDQPFGASSASMTGVALRPEFVTVELGTLRGGTSIANDINDRGWIVGESDQRAFIWRPETGMRELPRLIPNGSASATSINNEGWVAGQAYSADGLRAVKWSPDGTVYDLGTLPGGNYSRAWAINDQGVVVGEARDGGGRFIGFVHRGGTMVGLLPGGESTCEAYDINGAGTIALHCASHLGGARGYRVWSTGVYEPLVGASERERTSAAAINQLSAVVGSSAGQTGVRAYVWEAGSGRDLGGLGGNTWMVDINDAGETVGFYTPSGRDHVLMYSPRTGLLDVGTAGDGRARGTAINNLGDLVGHHDGLNNWFKAVIWKRVLRPGLDVQPAQISLSRSGLATVYLLSDATFDAAAATAGSARLYLDGRTVGVAVATRNGIPMTTLIDANRDGRMDRGFYFRVADLRAAGLSTETSSWVLKDLSSPATQRPYEAADGIAPVVVP